MAWNIWCYLSAIFTFVSLHWLLSLSVKNVHFHLGGKKLSSYRVWHNSSYMFGFFVKLKKKNCYFWVLPQYENRECGKRFTMSYGLPSFNFFNVFLPFFSSANVPIALDCHEVSYPTHRMIFFSSLAAVYKLNVQGALWKYACSSTLIFSTLLDYRNQVSFIMLSCSVFLVIYCLPWQHQALTFECNLMLGQGWL